MCNHARWRLQLTVQVLHENTCISAHQLFSPQPKGCALPSSKKQVDGAFLHNFKNVQWGSAILKLVSNYAISKQCMENSQLHKFANCAEHIHMYLVHDKPKKCPNDNELHRGDRFQAVAHQSQLTCSSKAEKEDVHQQSSRMVCL